MLKPGPAELLERIVAAAEEADRLGWHFNESNPLTAPLRDAGARLRADPGPTTDHSRR